MPSGSRPTPEAIEPRSPYGGAASKAAVYGQIQEEILDSRQQRGRTVLLVVDEAAAAYRVAVLTASISRRSPDDNRDF